MAHSLINVASMVALSMHYLHCHNINTVYSIGNLLARFLISISPMVVHKAMPFSV